MLDLGVASRILLSPKADFESRCAQAIAAVAGGNLKPRISQGPHLKPKPCALNPTRGHAKLLVKKPCDPL